MIRKLMIIGMIMTFLAATTYAFAEDVFITQNGSKYHKETCRLVKNKDNLIKMDKEEAIEQGYDPCKRCYKEDVVADKQDGNQGKTKNK